MDKKTVKNKIKEYLNSTARKSLILGIIALVQSAMLSITLKFLDNLKISIPCGIATVGIVLLNGFFIAYYAKYEADMKQLNAELKHVNNSLVETATKICAICKNTSESINAFSHSIKEENKLDLNVWSFDKSTQNICDAIYKIISESTGNKSIIVTYTKLEDEKNHKIKTVGYYHQSQMKLNVVNKVRCYDDVKIYYDAKIFKNNNPDIVVFENEDEIDKNFEYNDRVNDSGKYSQYIAVPVVCNDQKMIGVIQICAINHTKIANTKQELREIANKHVVQFAFLSLLFYKNEKSYLSIPSIKINDRRVD